MNIERVRTSGTFSLDGMDFQVDNNVWIVGDAHEVVIVDAAHDAEAIFDALGGRRVLMIVATHGHNDHVNAAASLAGMVHAPVALHPEDRMLWDAVYPDRSPDLALGDGQRIDFAGTHLSVLHTPGHSPGGVCLYLGDQGVLFSGDTLFAGGPGATGRSYSDFPTILSSIRERLLPLPPSTVVHTGHGEDTTVGSEAAHYDEWVSRGH